MYIITITERNGHQSRCRFPQLTTQPKHTMKNVKLNIRKLSRQGFSLVEMLVVIAVIGIIAAIAIPNIGNVNAAARTSTAKRNAQTIASTFSAAMAAGADMSSYIDEPTAVAGLTGGVTPTAGPFKDKQFIVPNLPAPGSQEYTELIGYLAWDNTNKVLNYKGGF